MAWKEEGADDYYAVNTVIGVCVVRLRVASHRGDSRIRLSLNGEATGTIDVPKAGSRQKWQTVIIPNLALNPAESRILRVESIEEGYNLSWAKSVNSVAESDEEVSAPDTGYGVQGDSKETYVGVGA